MTSGNKSADGHLVIDLAAEDKSPRNSREGYVNSDASLTVVSAKNIVVSVNSILHLDGVSIPAQGSGYLTVWADISHENGGYRKKIEISAVDLTPAGPGNHTAKKVLENIPPGRYSAYFDFMSYWRHGGRFTYSTYAAIEGDGENKWSYQLVGTQGPDDVRYESATVTLEVTG
jgi:hypothetical protein